MAFYDAPEAAGPAKLVIRNIGLLLSGDIDRPILDADTVSRTTAGSPRDRAARISTLERRDHDDRRQRHHDRRPA